MHTKQKYDTSMNEKKRKNNDHNNRNNEHRHSFKYLHQKPFSLLTPSGWSPHQKE